MARKLSNEAVLEQLKHGFAHFELVSSPVLSISPTIYSPANPVVLFGDYSHRFFARIAPLQGRGSPEAIWGAETYKVQKLKSDGRSLFLALVKGKNGNTLTPNEEIEHADLLRRDVHAFICTEHEKQNPLHKAARKAIEKNGGSLKRYCNRPTNQDHGGGEPELLVLSQKCKLPIIVYIQETEHPNRFRRIEKYGEEFGAGEGGRKPVRLLLSGRNHYDLLV